MFRPLGNYCHSTHQQILQIINNRDFPQGKKVSPFFVSVFTKTSGLFSLLIWTDCNFHLDFSLYGGLDNENFLTTLLVYEIFWVHIEQFCYSRHEKLNSPKFKQLFIKTSCVTTASQHFAFCLFFEMGSYYIVQAGLKLWGSSHPPASASQVVVTTGIQVYTTTPGFHIFTLGCQGLIICEVTKHDHGTETLFPKCE
jgi:hypothetical protein